MSTLRRLRICCANILFILNCFFVLLKLIIHLVFLNSKVLYHFCVSTLKTPIYFAQSQSSGRIMIQYLIVDLRPKDSLSLFYYYSNCVSSHQRVLFFVLFLNRIEVKISRQTLSESKNCVHTRFQQLTALLATHKFVLKKNFH